MRVRIVSGLSTYFAEKSGRQDLNLRPRDPQSRALAKLRHAPENSIIIQLALQNKFFLRPILKILPDPVKVQANSGVKR